jgi:hypothetical protein
MYLLLEKDKDKDYTHGTVKNGDASTISSINSIQPKVSVTARPPKSSTARGGVKIFVQLIYIIIDLVCRKTSSFASAAPTTAVSETAIYVIR